MDLFAFQRHVAKKRERLERVGHLRREEGRALFPPELTGLRQEREKSLSHLRERERNERRVDRASSSAMLMSFASIETLTELAAGADMERGQEVHLQDDASAPTVLNSIIPPVNEEDLIVK